MDTPIARFVSHPAWLRLMHWSMASSVLILVTSGWGIYNASPLFDFHFPVQALLGAELKESLLWHLAFMWVLLLSVVAHLIVRVALRRGHPALWPVSLRALCKDLLAAARWRLRHQAGHYNAAQRLLYIGVSFMLWVVIVSGALLWKPVQFGRVTQWLGGFQSARMIHFLAMRAVLAFVAVHLLMVPLVPRTPGSMLHGRRVATRLPHAPARGISGAR